MKLDEKAIDKLIEQALNERKVIVKYPKFTKADDRVVDIGSDAENLSSKKIKAGKYSNSPNAATIGTFDKITRQDGDANDLTYDDIAKAIASDDSDVDTLRGKLKSDYKKAFDNVEKYVDQGIKTDDQMGQIDTEKVIGVATSKSLAFKAMNTISADPSEPTAMGQYPEGIAAATQTFFADSGTLSARLSKINKFITKIENIDDARRAAGGSEAQLLSGLLVCDYLATLVKEVDSGAGAYMFEGFLAMLSGGRVTGKSKTDEGKMGAVDFVTNNSIAGSAKYYAKGGVGITQAIGGFTKGEPVFYVIALKKSKAGASTAVTKDATSDPAEIAELHIYNMVVMYLGWSPVLTNDGAILSTAFNNARNEVKGNHQFVVKTGGGQLIEYNVPKKGTLKVPTSDIKDINSWEAPSQKQKIKFNADWFQNPAIMTINLNGKNYQDVVRQQAEGTGNSVEKLTLALKNAQLAHQKIQKYASTGTQTEGDAAVKALLAAQSETKELGSKAFDQQLEESKFASLDQLIAETIRDIKKSIK